MLEGRAELAEVGIGNTIGFAFSLAFEKCNQAVGATRKAQQGAAQLGFAQNLEAFTAAVETQFDLAIDLHAGLAHGIGVGIRIDEAQAQIGFDPFISRGEIADCLAQIALRSCVGNDLNRALH